MKGKVSAESLKDIALFSHLTSEDLETIKDLMVIRQFKKHETILYEEDTNEYMYIIFNGRVKVVQYTEDGKEIILALHFSGEFFGELSLIDGKTVPGRVLALEDTTAAIISKENFFIMLSRHRKVFDNFLHILCSRLRESWEKIQILNFKNSTQRVKTLLLMLSENHGEKVEGDIVLNMKLTHQNIADMVGMTRETVTRIIDRWLTNGEIVIIDNRRICLKPQFLQKI